MPRSPMPWFRFYTETMHDPKVRELPVAQRWVWMAVLSAARQSPIAGYLLVAIRRPMGDQTLADIAAVPVKDVRKALEAFEANDMIHRDDDIGAWCVSNWASRQFESDDTTARTRRHRRNAQGTTLERSMPVPGNDFESVSETETETETESSSSSSDSRPHAQAVDNHAQNGDIVPSETWDAYAELALRKQTNVANPVPWKRSTADHARTEHALLAATWWREFELTPRRLAECLMDGQVRNVQRRAVT